MHVEFSEWYRLAGIEPTEALPKRWAAIETYSPGHQEIVSLARLFYGLGKPKEDFFAAFLGAVQTADPTFDARDTDNELSVLAGAELIDVIQRSDADLRDLAALSLVCAAGANLRPKPPVTRIPEIAATFLNERTLKRCVFSDDDLTESKDSVLAELAGKEPPLPDLANRLRQMQRQIDLAREESNMLWWLFSDSSRDEDKRWSKLSFPSVPLLAGKELADLTAVVPGPPAVKAFLSRVIQSAKAKATSTVSITEAINGLSIEWRERYTSESCPAEIENLLPVTLAIKLSLTAPSNGEWFPALAQGTRIPSNSKIAPEALAHQSFLECMLCRAWNQQNS